MLLLLVAAGPPVPAAAALAVPAAVLQLHLLLLLLVVVMLVLASAAAAPAVPWTSLQSKKPTARHFFRNPLETAKHHLISCRKWREIIRNNKVPRGRNVPSEILLESYSLTSAVFCYADAATAPAVPWTSLQGKTPTARHFFRNPLETAKHHLISCRKWREIIRNNKLPGGRNVPSEILLDYRKLVWLLLFCDSAMLLLLVAAGPAVPTVPGVLFDFCWSAMQLLLVAAGPPVPAALAVPAAVLQLHLLLLLGGDAGAGVCWCCCCSCRAMNQPPTEETKARHFFRNPLETAKHHLISCRRWREIIRNHKLPGGRNVPFEILLDIES